MNKKKLIVLGLFLSIFITQNLFAQGIDKFYLKEGKIAVWAGYTNIKMNNFNMLFEEFEKEYLDFNPSFKKVKNGYILGIDINIKILENIYIVPRLEYINGNNGKSSYSNNNKDFFLVENIKLSPSLIPLLAGIKYGANISEKIYLSHSIFGGIGFANVEIFQEGILGYKWKFGDKEYLIKRILSQTSSFKEKDIMIEFSDELKYTLNDYFDISLVCGYRFAKIKNMNILSKIDELDSVAVKNYKINKTIDLDFSGIVLAGSINFSF